MPDTLLDNIFELYASRASQTGQNPSVRLQYLVGRTENEAAVRSLVVAYSPLRYETLWRTGTSNNPIGGGLWQCSVDYGPFPISDANPAAGGTGSEDSNDQNQEGSNNPIGIEVQIEIGSQTQHITQSLETVDSEHIDDGSGRAIPDYKRAIAVSKDGVGGCDIIVPDLSWSETWTWNAAYVTWGYIRALRDLVGTTNTTTFRTFDPAEVLFVGASTPPAELGRRKITYHFRAGKNRPAVTISSDFDPVSKGAWDYLWVDYEPGTQGENFILQKPRGVYVEQVYEDGDFLRLGIGK